jgi:serine/threonine-protein kinase
MAMPLKIGTRINGKYEILKIIDTGGMSTVYIAMDIRLNKNWAIKEIVKNKSKLSDVEYRSLITETNILKGLDHTYIPRIVDIIELEDRTFVVMDYIEGKTLQDIVSTEGGLPQDKVIKWGIQLAEVLGYLHSRTPQIIYRDMKPGNIMLQPNGKIKLFDFGASRVLKDESSWKTVPLGTRGYAAPERYGSNSKFDVRSDIYELGMTLYHLLTGHDPSKSPEEVKPITEWNPNLNKGLEKIINKMTATNPDDRYQSTAELLYDLKNYEQLDTDFRNKLVTKMKTLIIMTVSTFVLFLSSGLGFYANARSVDNNFNAKLQEAITHNDPTIALEASRIKGDSLDSYDLMVKLFKQDDQFTNVEEVELLSAIQPNLDDLHGVKGYGDLAYSIGKLYLYYGSGIDGDHKNALKWLSEAVTYKSQYKSIAENLKNIIDARNALNGGSKDRGLHERYVKSLLNVASNYDNSTLENLTNIDWLYGYLVKNAGYLKGSQVTKEAIFNALVSTNKYVRSTSPTVKQEKDLKVKLLKQYESVQKAVNKIYR